jgi:hypothetical protein
MLDSFDLRESKHRVSSRVTSLDNSSIPVIRADEGTPENRKEKLSFMKRLLVGAPQLVGPRRAWDMYNDIREGRAEYAEKLFGAKMPTPEFSNLDEFNAFHRNAVAIIRREEEKAKTPKKRKAAAENEGYSEQIIEPALEHWRFQKENQIKSLIEDKWKADFYVSMCQRIQDTLRPDSSPADSDSFNSVLRRATEKYLRNESRPVLTNELGDYYNPYMMKKATTERLLHESCVRNKLEESLVPELIANEGEFVKLRSQADLPPEVLEPLQAFRGIVDWSFDPEARMDQKLSKVENLVNSILKDQPYVEETRRADSGFNSVVPRGRRGGWGHGKPASKDQEYQQSVRYPTLQRVAHSLPKDPQYRSQAIHAIQVLERARGWELSDKTKAINTMKEVLDNLSPSKMIVGKLEKALPLVRYGRFAPGNLPYTHKFVRRKPSNLLRRNRIRMYFRSVTAITPLSRRWADRRAKNTARNKKDNRR